MEQWEEIYHIAKKIIRRRGRVYASWIEMTGEIYYSEVWIRTILKRMVKAGLLVKDPTRPRGGYILPNNIVTAA